VTDNAPQPDIVIPHSRERGTVHRCPGCDAFIGTEIGLDGKVYLLVGNVRLYFLPGECAECGHELRFEPGWRKLQRAIKQLHARKDGL
jgi:hypothetical protein